MKWHIIIFCFLLCWLTPEVSFAKKGFLFDGKIDFKKNDFNIKFHSEEDGYADIKGGLSPDNQYQVYVDIAHLKTHSIELSTQITCSLAFKRDDEKLLRIHRGELTSQYSLVDYKPVEELKGSFLIDKNRIVLESLGFGQVNVEGYMETQFPYKLDLSVGLDSIELGQFLKFWVRKMNYDAKGFVTGKIRLSGNGQKVFLKGRLESYNGYIDKLKFDSFHLVAQGAYPRLNIARSVISQADGMSFVLGGEVDLSDNDNFKKQFKALKILPIVSESDTEKSWTIKKMRDEGDSTTEIKYLLRKNQSSGSVIREESGMLGIEKSMEF